MQPAEKLHLIGIDPLDPTRSTYVATSDAGQVKPCNSLYTEPARSLFALQVKGRRASSEQAVLSLLDVAQTSKYHQKSTVVALLFLYACPPV